MAFLLCVGFFGYGVMRKVGSSVGCPLSGRYVIPNISPQDVICIGAWLLLFNKKKHIFCVYPNFC